MNYISENIDKFCTEITSFFKSKNIPCTPVRDIVNSANTLSLEYKSLNDLFDFLNGKELIFVGLITEFINENEYQTAYNELRTEDYSVEMLKRYSNEINKIGYLKLFALTDSGHLMHTFEAYTILHDIIHGNFSSDIIEMEDNSISDEIMEECIQRVLKNQKLAKSDTLAYIQTLLEIELKNLKNGEKVYSSQKLEMARRIQTIYRDEIKPKQEEELSEKALDLKNQGFTKLEIARKLKLSISKLNKLI